MSNVDSEYLLHFNAEACGGRLCAVFSNILPLMGDCMAYEQAETAEFRKQDLNPGFGT